MLSTATVSFGLSFFGSVAQHFSGMPSVSRGGSDQRSMELAAKQVALGGGEFRGVRHGGDR